MNVPVAIPANPFGRIVLNTFADYVPDWDVPSYGRRPTTALSGAIARITGDARVDPNSKIHVLLGSPGYGKTHLFGRLAHGLADRALFAFIPPFEDFRRPLAHIRHHVVMSLFDETPTSHSHLARILAALCRPSFLSYLGRLPRPFDAQYAALIARLKDDDGAIFEIVGAVQSITPFQRVAESLRRLFPQLDGNVLDALALGWSPEKDHVRRWLRGEALPEEHARRIGLPDDPPDDLAVLTALAVLSAGCAPVVLCVDQLDRLLAEPHPAPLVFSNAMMTLRSEIPNLLVTLSCLKTGWETLSVSFHSAFKERTVEHELDLLTEEEAVELVRRRLAIWPGAPAGRTDWWPLDEASFRASLSTHEFLRPRGVLQMCEEQYERWVEQGDPNVLVKFGSDGPADLLTEFHREWDKELEKARTDPARSLENAQDQLLARALREGLSLRATKSDLATGVVRPRPPVEGPVPQVAGNPNPYRYTYHVALDGRNGPRSIIIALVAVHNARAFSHYFNAIVRCFHAGCVGAVLVTPKPDIVAGGGTKNEMEAETAKGRLRVVSLTDYPEDFARLASYLALLDRASAHDLTVASESLDVGHCRALVAQLGVLANPTLFDRILGGWVIPLETRVDGEPRTTAPEPTVAPHVGAAEEVRAGKKGDAVQTQTPPPQPQERPAPEPAADPFAEQRLEWAADGHDLIIKRLSELGARVRPTGSVEIGPTFARFLVAPYPATTISKVRSRAEDLKIGLRVDALPLVGSESGAISIDVELPERFRRTVRLDGMGSGPQKSGTPAPAFPVGQDVAGANHWLDLSDPNSCHLLVAGTTGSGKSEFLKAMIASLASRLGLGRVSFGLIDPKQVTFNFSEPMCPFFIRPVANGHDEALTIVQKAFDEAERRYSELKKRKFEDLAQWQAVDRNAPARLVLVCDEFADLMVDRESKKELETPLKRLGAKARAAGIHLVLATQRPEASVVTPLLRSNLPARICLRVASAADSKLILKEPDGADLLGRGDLLWQRGAGMVRLQSPYVDRAELEAILFRPG